MVQSETDVILKPAPEFAQTPAGEFAQFVAQTGGPNCTAYEALYAWSVAEAPAFWKALFTFADLRYSGILDPVVSDAQSVWPRPNWFEGVSLNFTENVLRHTGDGLAVIYQTEQQPRRTLTFDQLRNQVAQMAKWLKQQGVGANDVVAALMPNCPETLVAFLATASLGAIWTSCSPDAGVQFAVDRFEQTQPKILVSVASYVYDGKVFDLKDKLAEIAAKLPTLVATLTNYSEVLGESFAVPELTFTRLSFSHPLYILYSSGTTGKPKAIVHGAGGVLLQHIKEHRLHCGLRSGDKLFYYTTTSWMMWNWLMTCLASGITMVLFDGKPEPETVWRFVADEQVTAFGTSAPWISMSQKLKVSLPQNALPHLNLILSTGAPLLREQFDYIYTQIKPDVQLASISGGTDIVSCFAGGGPVAVTRGRLQCLGLGMAVDVVDEAGSPIRGSQGELVCRNPFPVMPLYFLNDPDGHKYKEAYFEKFPGLWAHGDYAILYEDNTLEIIGRSDSTIKRHGVRIGTSDIYNALEANTDIEDCLAVGRKSADNEDIILFVKVRDTVTDKNPLKKAIRQALTAQSPWLKPDVIVFVDDIPYTSNGKKSEVLVKNLLNGKPITNEAVLRNPGCLGQYRDFAAQKG